MPIVTAYFLATSAALQAQPVPPQQDDQPPEAAEGEIVVVGTGLSQAPSAAAYAVSEIERAEIVSAPSGRIEDVLANVAGFQQFRRSDSRSSNPSAQGVTLRALGGNATSRATGDQVAYPVIRQLECLADG